MHEDAEDPRIERMPASEEIYGCLVYLEANAHALRQLPARKQGIAAVKRVLLWQFLRERIDHHQHRAIASARSVEVPWADLAPALAVNSPSAAYNRAQRLQAAQLAEHPALDGRPVRRTPEAVAVARRTVAAREAEERRRREAAQRRHAAVLEAARGLLRHRAELAPDLDVLDWLDEVAAVIEDCETPVQVVSLETYVRATVRSLRSVERLSGEPSTRTPAAAEALRFAAAVGEGS
ncbi:hypothetical protein [Streptomyces zhihengii]|uniref:hypothetical protein n=1 Tax=Streptomyces zhihengii TaxID=1818004 RepID=UPI0033A2A71F